MDCFAADFFVHNYVFLHTKLVSEENILGYPAIKGLDILLR